MENPAQGDAPQPLEYAPRAAPAPRLSMSIFILSAAVCWGLLIFFCLVVPRFRQLYQGMRVRLPAPSQLILSLSDLVLDDFGWAFLLLLPFALAILLRKFSLRGRWVRLIFIVFYFIVALLTILALFMPMISLLQGISGSLGGR